MKITPREKRRHAACRLFSRGVIFTRARVSLALLSLRKNGGLLVVYKLTRGGPLIKRRKLPSRDLRLGENKSILPSRPRKKLHRLGDSQTHVRFLHTQQPPPLALEVYAGAEYKLRAVRACPAWLEARKRKLATATQASKHITKKTSGLLDRYAWGRGCRFTNIYNR